MKEIGTIQTLNGKKATVKIKRHAACGECGACQVGKEKMTMETLARNDINAEIGDEVAVEMEFANVLKATSIMYGIPLIAFILGCGLGYFFAVSLGWDEVIVPFFSGIILTIIMYMVIRAFDKKGKFNSKYEPVITEIVKSEKS
ncbi:MAG: SoxR reducing system RseC family protein [Eubacterium sp.]